MNDYLLAAVLGIVEGLTEFLPVSSTAHIRLALDMLRPEAMDDGFWKLFTVAIQLPAVLAVVVYFWPTIWKQVKSFFAPGKTLRDYLYHPITLVGIATVVTGVPAKLLSHAIKEHLGSLAVIGWALLVGGIIMAVVDTIYGRRERRLISDTQAAIAADQPPDPAVPQEIFDAVPEAVDTPRLTVHLDHMKPWQAVWIGLVQILSAVFPGTSRSMSTIAAGQIAGLTRAVALEFSFFLSIPIMAAAFASDMISSLKAPAPSKPNPEYIGRALTSHDHIVLMIGSIVSFLVALMVIAWFMSWVRRRGFLPFAVYRVIIGVVVLVAAYRSTHGG